MTDGKSRYYKKRQIIYLPDVSPNDYTDRIILCIPKFGWMVSRAFLSQQGKWRSSYATDYNTIDYSTPSDAEMDIIEASIDETLAGEDMSCDLREGLDNITNAIQHLQLSVECGSGGGCGSGGAGSTEGPPSDYIDDGETPPQGFETYSLYNNFKCHVARLIVEQIQADIAYLKGIGITELTATILGLAMLTPIPLDDIAVLVGVFVAYGVELLIDDIFDEILAQLGIDFDQLVCDLYFAVDTPEAIAVIDNWASANLSDVAALIIGFFTNNDAENRLFQLGNYLLSDNSCASCGEEGCELIDLVQGIDLGSNVYQSIPDGPTHRILMLFNESNGFECDDMPDVEIVTADPTGEELYDIYRLASTTNTGNGCTGWDIYCGDTKPTGSQPVRRLIITSATQFTATIIVTP